MKIIDGKKIAENIHYQLKEEIHALKAKPGLAFILIGEDAPSLSYVKMKKKRCEEIGFYSESHFLKENISQSDLLEVITKCNHNPSIHGILVQQPLPEHLSTKKVIETIDPKKDVDGFHPVNMGKALMGQEDGFLPCTPYGIIEILASENIDLQGKHVVILGRSNIVGKPLAAMLVQKKPLLNATVTVAHSQTKDLQKLCRQADVLVAAIGKPLFVDETFIRPNAIVIDVGINRIKKNDRFALVGDVHFDKVAPLCSHITKVPGGVGPMTIAMLLKNTFSSFKKLCLSS